MDKKDERVQRVHNMMIKADRLHKQLYSRMGQKLNIHRSQHMVLIHLARPDATGSQKEIADVFEISPPAVAMLLKRLEKNGYVEREVSPKDNRCNLIRLTEKGREIVAETMEIAEKCNRKTFAGFSEEELDLLQTLLDKMTVNLRTFLDKEEEDLSR